MIFFLTSFFLSVMAASTPLLLAATGELVAERAGVLNLGVEGMMLVGAVAGFAVGYSTGSTVLGVLAAALGGTALAAIFTSLTLTLLSNQTAAGLALTIFGRGFSSQWAWATLASRDQRYRNSTCRFSRNFRFSVRYCLDRTR
jgi:simple sugar transport system permease protein